jgi:hypothetical protein
MNYWNKDKNHQILLKKRTNWNQSLKPTSGKSSRPKKNSKSLQYLLILKV